MGHEVETIRPESLPQRAVPDVSGDPPRAGAGAGSRGRIDAFAPDAVHIATEGPLGPRGAHALPAHRTLRSRPRITRSFPNTSTPARACRSRSAIAGCAGFTRRAGADGRHAASCGGASPRGASPISPWSRGVDTELFRPGPRASLDVRRPVFLYVGRVAVEKNIDAFLSLDLPGTQGGWWATARSAPRLQRRYPDARRSSA